MSSPIQFAVTRTGTGAFKIVVQSENTILRAYETTLAGASNSIIQELNALEMPKDRK